VMIAPENATRERLNQQARAGLLGEGALSASGVVIGGREFRLGERVIARRNDRRRHVDNGMLATVRAINPHTGALTIALDAGGKRELDAAYVADYVEHAYALTGHGTQGASVEWAAVIGRPAEFTAEWAYTVLSRSRGETQLHVIAEPSIAARERGRYAPTEAAPTIEETIMRLERTMQRRQVEPPALEQRGTLESVNPNLAGTPPPQPNWRKLRQLHYRGPASKNVLSR